MACWVRHRIRRYTSTPDSATNCRENPITSFHISGPHFFSSEKQIQVSISWTSWVLISTNEWQSARARSYYFAIKQLNTYCTITINRYDLVAPLLLFFLRLQVLFPQHFVPSPSPSFSWNRLTIILTFWVTVDCLLSTLCCQWKTKCEELGANTFLCPNTHRLHLEKIHFMQNLSFERMVCHNWKTCRSSVS